MYTHPFSALYWRDAARELRDLRKLLFAALMIAACVVLGHIPSVPLFGGARVTYALFLYRAPLRVWRIFCAKLLTNVQNVVLGALWMAILNSSGSFSLATWYATAAGSAVKNLIMLPVQTVMLVLLFKALQPALCRADMLPRQAARAAVRR